MGKRYISEVIEYKEDPRIVLGMMSSHRWRMDPKVLLFSMARYKFVSKMLAGKKNVLEIGCGDGWGAHIVLPEVGKIRCVDMDPLLIEECRNNIKTEGLSFEVKDLMEGPITPKSDAIYLLDVLEHVEKKDEDIFLTNITRSMVADGVCIVGIPSLESQKYASKPSRKSHVNCKSGVDLRVFLQKYFKNVFLFSMNDEVVHTGFDKMAHYLLALCVGVKDNVSS